MHKLLARILAVAAVTPLVANATLEKCGISEVDGKLLSKVDSELVTLEVKSPIATPLTINFVRLRKETAFKISSFRNLNVSAEVRIINIKSDTEVDAEFIRAKLSQPIRVGAAMENSSARLVRVDKHDCP